MTSHDDLVLSPQDIEAARAFVARAEAATAALPSSHTYPVEIQRSMMVAGGEPRHDAAVDSELAGVPVRVFTPPSPRGTYLHIHGGGWTAGSNDIQDTRLWRFATEATVRVLSVEYRLAPEHPFPACIDDCIAVARVLVDAGGGPLVIGGESAGAHLSALTLTRVREGFAGANLAYGCFDLGMSESQRAWGERILVLSTPIIRWHLDQLLPGIDDDTRRDPSISPLYADLTGMPPALLTVGSDDPMLDDSRLLAAQWPGARLDVYEGGFHAFDLMPLAIGEIATKRQVEFVRSCVG